jgi:hypothetical protein
MTKQSLNLLPNEKRKSKRIASQSTKPVAIVAPSQLDLHESIFSSVEWATAIAALTHRHRRYMVEDCLQCDTNESLLLLISLKYPSFATGWQSHLSAIYKAFPTSALHFQDGGVFFSVKEQVVKNPIHKLLMAGGYSITTFLELFSFTWWFFFGS